MYISYASIDLSHSYSHIHSLPQVLLFWRELGISLVGSIFAKVEWHLSNLHEPWESKCARRTHFLTRSGCAAAREHIYFYFRINSSRAGCGFIKELDAADDPYGNHTLIHVATDTCFCSGFCMVLYTIDSSKST